MYENGVMMQFFEWNVPPGMLWKQMRSEAAELARHGITALWIPPASKSFEGVEDRGYGLYDLYDLGEFDQKGTVETRYGSREDLLEAIKEAHAQGIHIYADIVLDHMMGADGMEAVYAQDCSEDNRFKPEGSAEQIDAWTHFTFQGRNRKYSAFEWHWYHFTGIDHDARSEEDGIFKLGNKQWEQEVDKENGNFDYLMGASLDLSRDDVQEELYRWGSWFVRTTGVDGFRLDAVKHMRFSFYKEWLHALREEFGKEFFSVAEYWHRDLAALKNYVEVTGGAASLFDVPLHFRFKEASESGADFDMRTIFDGTLTKDTPALAVPFVDNHDSQPRQALESWVKQWFRPLAYALILLRKDGYPCIFYGDWYGMPHSEIPDMREELVVMLEARTQSAFGEQHDYFDHPNTIGWTREGDEENPDSGLAVLLTTGSAGEKSMYVGKHSAGAEFYDATGRITERVRIDDDGMGLFKVGDGSVSVWRKAADAEA